MACFKGCFAGLFGSAKPDVLPDCSPGHMISHEPAATIDDALKLERPRTGSWMVSPNLNLSSWASPLPRQHSESLDAPVEIELTFEEGPGISASGSDKKQIPQLDTDIPTGRLGVDQRGRPRSRFEAEMLVASPGGLPPPMTATEREDIIRQLLPTATFQMLSKVPRPLLLKHDDSAKKLRRQLMRGATVVFVNAGLPGKRFTFEIAASLGIKPVILEHPDSWSKSLVDEGLVAKFLPVDMTQSSEAIFEQSLQLIKQLGQDGLTGPVDGIASFVELSIPLVARLTEALGLPGHRPASVDSARNKHATRACLKAANLPTPRNFLITDASKLQEAMQQVRFPAVLKPVSGAASLGVKKVTSEAEMRKCYKEIVDELSSLVVISGALVQNDGSNSGIKAENVDLTVLMEQFLDGPEVDVDVVMSDGEFRYACVADNGPTLEPYFNETWAVCPSLLPRDQQVALKELSIASVKALGFSSGVFHVECKYTSTGPQLIEVNARMGGGQVHECNRLTWGVCLVEETLLAALGIPSRPLVPKQPLSATAYCYVNAMTSGEVVDMSGLEALRRREGVVWAKPLTKVGASVVGPDDGLPTWLCDLFVRKDTAKEALAFLQELEAEGPVKVASRR
eukprot:TRINITY_DN10437_c0_g1_i2.p1 TRINITY_DN10437_c0_g1~~TRINITY_DN10437_c0_g1_i2.p1  ORF type:complete len:625 (+),score=118.02 TRINITY_DN10437_c0_g1_i2:69-1943(+)